MSKCYTLANGVQKRCVRVMKIPIPGLGDRLRARRECEPRPAAPDPADEKVIERLKVARKERAGVTIAPSITPGPDVRTER